MKKPLIVNPNLNTNDIFKLPEIYDDVPEIIEPEVEESTINEDTSDDESGTVTSVKDGVAWITGLNNVQVGEMIMFVESNLTGMALNLETDSVGCIIFGDDTNVFQDEKVLRLKKLVTTPVGPELLGHVVDGIGTILDDDEELKRLQMERAEGQIGRAHV